MGLVISGDSSICSYISKRYLMINLTIKRISSDLTNGTLGVLSVDGKPMFLTVERPWINNEKSVSCIPPGRYDVGWTATMTAGNLDGQTLTVKGVPGRDNIRFHAGNTQHDSEGCVIVGLQYGDFGGTQGVGNSRPAVYRFLKMIKDSGDSDIQLFIFNCYN